MTAERPYNLSVNAIIRRHVDVVPQLSIKIDLLVIIGPSVRKVSRVCKRGVFFSKLLPNDHKQIC